MPQAADFPTVFPHAGGKARQVGSAKGRCFADGRAQHGFVQDVRLELHQKLVAGSTAIHFQGGDGLAHIQLHRVHQVIALISDGLLRRADDMVLGGAAGNAHNGPAGVHIPVGCAQSGKGRNNIHPAVIRHLLGVILRIPAFLDHAQAIAHPLDDRPAHKHTALQRILHLAVQADGNGGQQAIFAAADGIAGVHQQKAAGTIGVFGFAFGKTALAKQCGLLVARNTGHRHLYAAQVGVTVNLAGIRHTRQHGAGDIQRVQQCIIPVQLVDIIQHGAAGVGSVRYMHLAAGQLPHQPAVHRAKQNFSRLCALPCARHMVQNPLDFGCGKVGIRHKAGILFDILCHARLAEQLIHQRCSAAALPHNGVINGAAGRFFPQNRGFALVGNADGGNIMRIHAALGYHLVHHAILAGPYLHRVVLHPALLGV